MVLVWMFAWSIFSSDGGAPQVAVAPPARDAAMVASIEARLVASKAAVAALKRTHRTL